MDDSAEIGDRAISYLGINLVILLPFFNASWSSMLFNHVVPLCFFY